MKIVKKLIAYILIILLITTFIPIAYGQTDTTINDKTEYRIYASDGVSYCSYENRFNVKNLGNKLTQISF